MEFLLGLFAFTVFAAETTYNSVLSPIPDDHYRPAIASVQSITTFGELDIIQKPVEITDILGETTTRPILTGSATPMITPSSTPEPTIPPVPAVPIARLSKSRYVIAVLGDSMVDTLGPKIGNLDGVLETSYSGTDFEVYNYGVGATNIEYGKSRLTTDYEYLGQNIPSLLSRNPDIVVIESFGYNPFPFDEGAMDKHWLALAEIIDIIKKHDSTTKIIIAATIAPNSTRFGDGAPGIAFSAEDKRQQTTNIKKYLQNAIHFATSENYPLVDAYHPSLDKNGDGKLEYINEGDHIHYSREGIRFMEQLIAEAIYKIIK